MTLSRRKFAILSALTGFGLSLGIPWLAKAEIEPPVFVTEENLSRALTGPWEPGVLTVEKLLQAKEILLNAPSRGFISIHSDNVKLIQSWEK